MDFSDALDFLKDGHKMTREGWKNVSYIAVQTPDLLSKMTRPYIYAVDVEGNLVPWLASQVDIFATDWTRHG